MTETAIPDPLPELREKAAAAAREWIAAADPDLVDLMGRLTHHDRVRWDAEDYVTDDDIGPNGDGRQVVTDGMEYAEAIGSAYDTPAYPGAEHDHALLVDLDVSAWLVPSSSGPGHSHLYVRLPNPLPTEDLFDFLRAAVKIGLVEEGYVNACESRGMTSLRAPWIRKGEEPAYVAHQRRQAAEAQRLAEQGGATVLEF